RLAALYPPLPPPPRSPLFPYTTLFRSAEATLAGSPFIAVTGPPRPFSGGSSADVRFGGVLRWGASVPPRQGRTLVLRRGPRGDRSEEHTSELQSRVELVCRLLLEKKRNLILLLVDGEHDRLDLLALREHVGRSRDSLGPGRLGGVYEYFIAVLDFHARAGRNADTE